MLTYALVMMRKQLQVELCGVLANPEAAASITGGPRFYVLHYHACSVQRGKKQVSLRKVLKEEEEPLTLSDLHLRYTSFSYRV